jgi:glycosyltransferase involved in cell wall biosynthesis
MKRPTVSVIIPTHNGARWVAESVTSALRQAYSPAEVIVVDDGSTDETAAVLRQFGPRIQVIHGPQGGIGAARNSGLAQASGDYLAFLDHDDLWREDKLEKQVDYALRHPAVVVVYSDATEFDERGTVHQSYLDLFPRLRASEDIFFALVHFSIPLMSTVLIRSSFVREHSLTFPEDVSGVDDLGLLLEVVERKGQFGCIDERLTRRRLHTRNLSKDHHNRFSTRVRLYAQLLARFAGAQPAYKKALRWGWRHASFCLGEWHWGQGDPTTAREYFRQAWGADRLGLRSLSYSAASCLPAGAVRWLRDVKRRVSARANESTLAPQAQGGTNP